MTESSHAVFVSHAAEAEYRHALALAPDNDEARSSLGNLDVHLARAGLDEP